MLSVTLTAKSLASITCTKDQHGEGTGFDCFLTKCSAVAYCYCQCFINNYIVFGPCRLVLIVPHMRGLLRTMHQHGVLRHSNLKGY
jgi:hypothetical protein